MQPAAVTQIVAQYETCGLTPEQIAEGEELELGAVKAILFASSAAYREATKTNEPGKSADFNEDDNELALRVARRVAQFAEDDSVALKAAMFIRNDKKGRLDARKGLRSLHLNVAVLNEHFRKASEALADRLTPTKQIERVGKNESKDIEVSATVQPA